MGVRRSTCATGCGCGPHARRRPCACAVGRAARPRTRPEPPGPARPVRFALAGREPRVAFDLPAGRGRMPSRHHGYAVHARPVAHLNPDDLPFLFRQARIHLAQGATPLRLAIRTISNLTGAALSIRQRGKEAVTCQTVSSPRLLCRPSPTRRSRPPVRRPPCSELADGSEILGAALKIFAALPPIS